jgi:hypothetical protein
MHSYKIPIVGIRCIALILAVTKAMAFDVGMNLGPSDLRPRPPQIGGIDQTRQSSQTPSLQQGHQNGFCLVFSMMSRHHQGIAQAIGSQFFQATVTK